MGTRHLIAVVDNGEFRIAQYGQWDGYPDGQGIGVLEFAKKYLTNKKGVDAFRKKLALLSWLDDKDLQVFLDSIGASDGWLNAENVRRYNEKYPLLSRDHGAKILTLVNELEKPEVVQNRMEFAADSLFCEWAYVIDLDSSTLDVYEGLNESPLSPVERFANLPKSDNEYYQVKLVATWKLDQLPSKKKFLATFEEKEEDVEVEQTLCCPNTSDTSAAHHDSCAA